MLDPAEPQRTPEKHSALFKNFSFDDRLRNRIKIAEGYKKTSMSLDEETSSATSATGASGGGGVGVSRRLLQQQRAIAEPGDRKMSRDALYEGIFKKHRSAIFALGSFVRMLKNKNSQYDTIRNNGEGDGERDEV